MIDDDKGNDNDDIDSGQDDDDVEDLYEMVSRHRETLPLRQWFLTFLEVLNPTSSIHAVIDPFIVAKMQCGFFFKFKTHVYNNILYYCTNWPSRV